MVKVAISGICGKMGRRILNIAKDTDEVKVVLGLESSGHPDVGKKIDDVQVLDDIQKINECDCLIEFTTPDATISHLKSLVNNKKPVVIGTTGLTDAQQDELKEASKIIPVVLAPNMSVGVNLLFELVKSAAAILKGYEVLVSEAHHIHKKDAPSGTAKKIAQIINGEGLGLKTEDIESVREDEIVGDHKIVFDSPVDRIELAHSAKTRDIFAEGAVKAALWIVSKEPGLYSMKDVLSL